MCLRWIWTIGKGVWPHCSGGLHYKSLENVEVGQHTEELLTCLCATGGQSRAKLAVCKGTIRARNKKLAGYIDLDLGKSSTAVKVFYIPLFADMEGSRYEGERVQFHLAFTLDKGYEAYEVSHSEVPVLWQTGKFYHHRFCAEQWLRFKTER